MQKMIQEYLKQQKFYALNTKEFSLYLKNTNSAYQNHMKFRR